jgi:hypothetical protein
MLLRSCLKQMLLIVGCYCHRTTLPALCCQPVPAPAPRSSCRQLYPRSKRFVNLFCFLLLHCSEGLDFSPMSRDEVVAHVHELLAAALYEHTHLFYSRHLDTLLLACLYGFCKVNKLQQVRAGLQGPGYCCVQVAKSRARLGPSLRYTKQPETCRPTQTSHVWLFPGLVMRQHQLGCSWCIGATWWRCTGSTLIWGYGCMTIQGLAYASDALAASSSATQGQTPCATAAAAAASDNLSGDSDPLQAPGSRQAGGVQDRGAAAHRPPPGHTD